MVEIHDLHVRFHGASREAVAGIDLTIRDGEVVGLVGESGSGKTVTAMTLSGLIERKKVTLSGEVRCDGRDILRLPRAELRAIQGRELGVVFQEPMTAMDPLMRIGPQVEEALAVHTQLTKEQRRGLIELLKHFAISVTGVRPVAEAIVTAGGVKVSEVKPNTMESKLVEGLYFAGEILDVDA